MALTVETWSRGAGDKPLNVFEVRIVVQFLIVVHAFIHNDFEIIFPVVA